jgi:hypothetical protein
LSQAEHHRQPHLSAAAFGWWKGQLSPVRTRAEPAPAKNKTGGNDGSFVELTMVGCAAQREKELEFEYSLGHVIEKRFYVIAPPEAKKEIDEAGVDIESVADFG